MVVFFDICSSTKLLEDLLTTENEIIWRRLIIALKKFLNAHSEVYGYEIHKFLGDGWIILFDEDSVTGDELLVFCSRLCLEYRRLFESHVRSLLEGSGYLIGITFGVDRGTLVGIKMNGKKEYIGRALNVAARLQGAIKQKDKTPQWKMLMSNPAFSRLALSKVAKHSEVTRVLHNLSTGAEYHARKIVLLNASNLNALER